MSLQNFTIIEKSSESDQLLYCNSLYNIATFSQELPLGNCVLLLKSLGMQLTVVVDCCNTTVGDVLKLMMSKISNK